MLSRRIAASRTGPGTITSAAPPPDASTPLVITQIFLYVLQYIYHEFLLWIIQNPVTGSDAPQQTKTPVILIPCD